MSPSGAPLMDLLRRQIAAQGPMTVADYMALALGHPEHGYYRARDPLGTDGDFTTAPEISQMMGELIGLWTGQVWLDQGAPDPVSLIELGPGRGTLMADALRALRIVPGFLDAVRVRLVETSPVLTARQQSALAGHPVTWHTGLTDALAADDSPVLILANEFFDALPIHQFVRRDGAWRERMVGLDEAGALCFGLASDPAPLDRPGPDGAMLERCPAGESIAAEIAAAIAVRGGAGLMIDYGHDRPGYGETLQAVKAHAFHPVLETPGEADLTAHVDFAALADAATAGGAAVWGPIGQGPFLQALGIEARAARLKAATGPDQAKAVDAALARLTGPGQMGDLFKVLAMSAPQAPPPPPFQPDQRRPASPGARAEPPAPRTL